MNMNLFRSFAELRHAFFSHDAWPPLIRLVIFPLLDSHDFAWISVKYLLVLNVGLMDGLLGVAGMMTLLVIMDHALIPYV